MLLVVNCWLLSPDRLVELTFHTLSNFLGRIMIGAELHCLILCFVHWLFGVYRDCFVFVSIG